MKTDIEPEGIPTQMQLAAVTITTLDDYEQATARAAELAGRTGAAAQREVAALTAAIMAWDESHDDATGWR